MCASASAFLLSINDQRIGSSKHIRAYFSTTTTIYLVPPAVYISNGKKKHGKEVWKRQTAKGGGKGTGETAEWSKYPDV
jgi:hypothetical protein